MAADNTAFKSPKFNPLDWQAQYSGGGDGIPTQVTGYVGANGQTITQQQFDAMMAAQHNADLAAQGLNPDGSPIKPGYAGYTDENGNLQDKYRIHLNTLDPNTLEGYNLLKQLATEKGPSQYAQIANQQAARSRQDAIDAGAAQAASGLSFAQNNMAMRGGISSGARERTAMQGARDLLSTRQDAYRQEGNSLLDIMKQDEAMKRDALARFGTAEGQLALSNLGIQNQEAQYNMGTLLRDKDMQNSWNMDTYKAALDKWGAQQQAAATRNSGGGGK